MDYGYAYAMATKLRHSVEVRLDILKKRLGYEIGKAETALKNKVPYRQDKPLNIPSVR